MKSKKRKRPETPKRRKTENESPGAEYRLNRFLARAGYASRREADGLIHEGLVTVNGRVVRAPGTRLNPETDAIKVDGKRVFKLPSFAYYLLHKPRGVVCTMEDPEGRPCLGDLLKNVRGRPVPAGRLDFDTDGLILCTNDGDMVQKIIHPRYKVKKVYRVKISGVPDRRALKRIETGIPLDGKKTLPAKVSVLKQGDRNAWIRLTLYEGRNRQVKRMMSHFGFRVLKLQRVALGPFSTEGLGRGKFRKLSPAEIKKLHSYLAELDKREKRL